MQALALGSDDQMQLVEANVPAPRRGEILVEVHAAPVNEIDVEIRSGNWKSAVRKFRKSGPVVTGFELAGIARSDGKTIRSGDRVTAYVHLFNGPRTHAGRVCVREHDLIAIPERMAFADAAALSSSALTAIEIVERLRPLGPNRRVLIVGATGGAGIYTLQLAKSRGAHVTAVCSAANAEWIERHGADVVRDNAAASPFVKGDRFDLVVDTPAKYTRAKAAPFLAPGGMYVTTNPFKDLGGFVVSIFSSRKSGYLLMLSTTQAKLKRMIDLHLQGTFVPVIDSRFGLAQANEAFGRFATRGKRGRVILEMQHPN